MNRTHFISAFLVSWLAVSLASAESPIRPVDRIAIVGNTFADQLRVHGYLETLLLQRSNENPVSIRNLGWGGDMVHARDRPTNFPSEELTLTAHKTDVIVACFGMGESFNGQPGIAEFRNQLRSFIASHRGKKYNGKSQVRLILVSPIACEDLGRLTPQRKKRNHELEAYTDAIREVSAEARIPFVDLFSASRYLMDEAAGPNLTTNGIHLNPYGYWALSHTFCDQLMVSDVTESPLPWRISIDAATASGDARGVNLSELSADQNGLSFHIAETSFPNLPPPTDANLPPQLQLVRDTLVIQNLEPGKYQLTVDGQPVVTADANAWSEGVAVDSSPAHEAAEAYRSLVKDKNLQFTYSWKALNQVHIVGERRTSPSGRALPREIVAFNQLANERDAELRKGIELKTRIWRVMRVGE